MYEEILRKHAAHESVDLVRLGAALQGEATWTGVLVFATSLLAASLSCVAFGLLYLTVLKGRHDRAEKTETREGGTSLGMGPRVTLLDDEVPIQLAPRAASHEGFPHVRRRARAESGRAAEGVHPAWPDLAEVQGLGPSLLVALHRREVEEATGPPLEPSDENAPTAVN